MTSNHLNINLLKYPSKKHQNLIKPHQITINPSKNPKNLINPNQITIKSKIHPVLTMTPYPNQDKIPIKNYLSPPSKITTFKPNPNTSPILTINSHTHVSKSFNSPHKKSIDSIKNLELTLKKLMTNLLNSLIKI